MDSKTNTNRLGDPVGSKYKIVRDYFRGGHRTIKRFLSLEEATEWVRNPESSSSTCQTAKAKHRTKVMGRWMDGINLEK